MSEISEQEHDCKTEVITDNIDVDNNKESSSFNDLKEINDTSLKTNELCDIESKIVKDIQTEIHIEDDKCNKENVFPNLNDIQDRNIKEDIQKQLEKDLQIFSSPKSLKTIQIENDSSVEIFKDNQIINIDVVKIENTTTDNFKLPLKSPVKNKKCFIKFSLTDKEVLQNTNFNLDLESFKNHYLSEVDGERAKNKIDTIITDSRVSKRNLRKRKLTDNNMIKRKKRKLEIQKSNIDNINEEMCPNPSIEDYNEINEQKTIVEDTNMQKETSVNTILKDTDIKCEIKKEGGTFAIDNNGNLDNIRKVNKKKNKRRKRKVIKGKRTKRNVKKSKDTSVKVSLKNRNNVQLDINTNERNRTDKKLKTKLSIRNKKLELKIKWREERFKLRITETKRKRRLVKNKKSFKQYVLKYNVDENSFIAKPETEITPPKRKYIKQEKPQDKLVQTSIQSFFKKVP